MLHIFCDRGTTRASPEKADLGFPASGFGVFSCGSNRVDSPPGETWGRFATIAKNLQNGAENVFSALTSGE